MAFHLKTGDLLPVLDATLIGADGAPIDLSSATVAFTMTKVGSTTPKISARSCTIRQATLGQISMAWTGTDSDTAGTYRGEFKVTISGKSMTVPNYNYVEIIISATL